MDADTTGDTSQLSESSSATPRPRAFTVLDICIESCPLNRLDPERNKHQLHEDMQGHWVRWVLVRTKIAQLDVIFRGARTGRKHEDST